MKKVYHLSTCSTCKRIINELEALLDGFEFQDIKNVSIAAESLDFLAERVGSYESLFSRKAMKFRAMGLHEKALEESDYRSLILSEYTFLKRPVFIDGDDVFVGNSKKTIAELKQHLEQVQ